MKSAEQILDRAWINLIIANRGIMETQNEIAVDARDGKRGEWQNVIASRGLTSEMSEQEQKAFGTPVGELAMEDLQWMTWGYETLAPLLWSIGMERFEPKVCGRPCRKDFHALIGHHKCPVSLAPKAALRDRSEIQRVRDIAFLWHWRVRERIRNKHFDERDAADLVRAVFGSEFDAVLQRIPNGGKPKDFQVEGVRFNDLHEQVFTITHWQARYFHQTYEWILGDAAWDDTDTGT